MTSLSISATPSLGADILARIRGSSTLLWWTVLAMLGLAIVCVALQFADGRAVNGVSTWLKPAKFFSSLAIQFATVGWALSYLPAAEQKARVMRMAIPVMLLMGWGEMLYISFRAARAEASHFNISTPTTQLLYNLMGVGAVLMLVIAGYVGLRLWRHRRDGVMTEAAAVGLIAGAVLGGLAGAYVGAQLSHSVGGDLSDATGTGFFGWSTTGGDLRIAHFVGMHAAQIVPLAALSGRRSLVWVAALLCTLITGAVFLQALMGVPLFRG
jgi:hypothetical protein